ncbi:unnamed protein product [Ilex paraguariensis]|uniref:Uncharacterized protein n=1 Tax=Ilex paraguariensis TaxID=185542 RepID=A0ABC8V3N5_9AQUA
MNFALRLQTTLPPPIRIGPEFWSSMTQKLQKKNEANMFLFFKSPRNKRKICIINKADQIKKLTIFPKKKLGKYYIPSTKEDWRQKQKGLMQKDISDSGK